MGDHFTNARDLERALVQADLEALHRAARGIADARPDQYPADWSPYLYELRQAAETALAADTLTDAAYAAGRVAESCGACHAALGRGPKFGDSRPPTVGNDATSLMQRHRWATTRMWEGVVGPDEQAWFLATDRFFPSLPPCRPGLDDADFDHAAIEALKVRVEEIGTRAREARGTTRRAEIYGQYLATCATCHASGC